MARVLTEPELVAIWRGTEGIGDYNAIVRVLLLSGQRREEIGGLAWDEINVELRQIELAPRRVKNGRAHTIPLSDAALGIIQNLTINPGRGHIFGSGAGPFSGWSKSKKRLDETLAGEVAPWRVHDLRRTFATLASDLDFAAPHVIEMALNHWSGSKSGIVATYNRARYDRERRTLMDKWAEHILGIAHAQKL